MLPLVLEILSVFPEQVARASLTQEKKQIVHEVLNAATPNVLG